MKATFLGHSCFLLEIGGYKLILDPFIRPNELTKGLIDFTSLQADYILLSHGHWDHTADAEDLLKQTGATLIANWEICSYYQKLGIEKVHPMNTGGKWPFDFGTLRLTPAVHSSSFPDGSYAGSANGFIIETDAAAYYYSGDTDLFTDMHLIGERYKIKAAFLPIGDNFTMGYEEALNAAKWLKTNKIIGMHFDTFPYVAIDKQAASQAAAAYGIDLILPDIAAAYAL